MTTTKFSKVLGEVEILNQDTTTTTVKVLKTGEVKKLLNQYANLSDEPFVKVAKKKAAPARKLTQEEKDHLEYIQPKLRWMEERSRQDRKNGRHGAISLWK